MSSVSRQQQILYMQRFYPVPKFIMMKFPEKQTESTLSIVSSKSQTMKDFNIEKKLEIENQQYQRKYEVSQIKKNEFFYNQDHSNYAKNVRSVNQSQWQKELLEDLTFNQNSNKKSKKLHFSSQKGNNFHNFFQASQKQHSVASQNHSKELFFAELQFETKDNVEMIQKQKININTSQQKRQNQDNPISVKKLITNTELIRLEQTLQPLVKNLFKNEFFLPLKKHYQSLNYSYSYCKNCHLLVKIQFNKITCLNCLKLNKRHALKKKITPNLLN